MSDPRASANLATCAARLARIRDLACRVFEDSAKAERWLIRPLAVLGKKAPVDLVMTEDGTRLLETILAKISWGVAP